MARGFVYLTAVADVASRMVLARKGAITLEACHAREIIVQAFALLGAENVNTIGAASSPPKSSPRPCSTAAASSLWTGAAHSGTMSSSNVCGAA
jgi:hypothetical protein